MASGENALVCQWCALQICYKTIATPEKAVVRFKDVWILAYQTVSQLAKRRMLLFCHSGLDPESIAVSGA